MFDIVFTNFQQWLVWAWLFVFSIVAIKHERRNEPARKEKKQKETATSCDFSAQFSKKAQKSFNIAAAIGIALVVYVFICWWNGIQHNEYDVFGLLKDEYNRDVNQLVSYIVSYVVIGALICDIIYLIQYSQTNYHIQYAYLVLNAEELIARNPGYPLYTVKLADIESVAVIEDILGRTSLDKIVIRTPGGLTTYSQDIWGVENAYHVKSVIEQKVKEAKEKKNTSAEK